MKNTELVKLKADMTMWWERGTSVTSSTHVLIENIDSYVANNKEDIQALDIMPEEMQHGLFEAMFKGPTKAIRAAAEKVLKDYNESIRLNSEE